MANGIQEAGHGAKEEESERDATSASAVRDEKETGSPLGQQDEDKTQPVHTLFNLQLVKKGDALYDVVESLKRVEELSHILVWSLSGRRPRDSDDLDVLCQPLSMDLIELPR